MFVSSGKKSRNMSQWSVSQGITHLKRHILETVLIGQNSLNWNCVFCFVWSVSHSALVGFRVYIFLFVCLYCLFLVGNLFGFENIFGRQSKGVYLLIRNTIKSPNIEQIYVVSFLITRSKLYCSICLYNVHRTTHVCIYWIPAISKYLPTSKHYFCRKKMK
jgi:hypothetical protein